MNLHQSHQEECKSCHSWVGPEQSGPGDAQAFSEISDKTTSNLILASQFQNSSESSVNSGYRWKEVCGRDIWMSPVLRQQSPIGRWDDQHGLFPLVGPPQPTDLWPYLWLTQFSFREWDCQPNAFLIRRFKSHLDGPGTSLRHFHDTQLLSHIGQDSVAF